MALRSSGACRHLVRCFAILIPAPRRRRCTVMGNTFSAQVGEWCPSPVRTAAISSSGTPALASSSTRSRMRDPFVRSAIALTRILTSSVLQAPPRQTMRTLAMSCSPRSRTTFSTRQRRSDLRCLSLASSHISGNWPARTTTLVLIDFPIGGWLLACDDRCRSRVSSASRTAHRAASQRRSSSPATSRL